MRKEKKLDARVLYLVLSLEGKGAP